MRLLATGLTLLALVLWTLHQGTLLVLWSGPALFLVVCGGLALFVAAHGLRGFQVLREALYSSADVARQRTGAELARSMARGFITIGWLGSLLTVVALTPKFGDPTALGPAVASLAYPALYGHLFAALIGSGLAQPLRVRSARAPA